MSRVALFAFLLVVVAVACACDTNECGDIGTLDITTNQVCFSVKYTCSVPVTVVQSQACGSMFSSYGIHSDQGASCTLDITCADGRTETYQAYWATNGTCVPVQVPGLYTGTVCDVDGGVSPLDAGEAGE